MRKSRNDRDIAGRIHLFYILRSWLVENSSSLQIGKV
jgi:hypothetical protein